MFQSFSGILILREKNVLVFMADKPLFADGMEAIGWRYGGTPPLGMVV